MSGQAKTGTQAKASATEKTTADVKGKSQQWQPASLIDDVKGLDRDNFAYRWVSKDAKNMSKKRSEGWIPVSKLEGDKVEHMRSAQDPDGGATISETSVEERDMVLMKMPRELNESRKDYFRKKTSEQMSTVVNEARDGGATTGQIVIEGEGQVPRVID